MAEPDETAELQARLDALRASTAGERDPIRLAYLEALARRAAAQPGPIRLALNAKITAAAGELATRAAPAPSDIEQTSDTSPLADLLAHIRLHAQPHPDANPPATQNATVNRNFRPNSKGASSAHTDPGPELKSVAYFHETWSKLSTEQQLTQTLAQAPENAGPMNSQHLVLRSLQVMHEIAPDYLQGFMSYIDTLIWLEQADPTRLAAGRALAGEGETRTRTTKRHGANR